MVCSHGLMCSAKQDGDTGSQVLSTTGTYSHIANKNTDRDALPGKLQNGTGTAEQKFKFTIVSSDAAILRTIAMLLETGQVQLPSPCCHNVLPWATVESLRCG